MLKGIAVSGGFAVGKILKLAERKSKYSLSFYAGEASEKQRFERACHAFSEHTQHIEGSIRRIVGEQEAAIFKGHRLMADDPEMQAQVLRRIRLGLNAETAMESTCDAFIEAFSAAGQELTRQRAADIRDVKQALLEILCQTRPHNPEIPAGSVIAARELTPSAVRFLHRRTTLAVLCEHGGRASHTAILLRAMGIPAVFSVKGLLHTLENGQRVIVDANKGEIIPV